MDTKTKTEKITLDELYPKLLHQYKIICHCLAIAESAINGSNSFMDKIKDIENKTASEACQENELLMMRARLVLELLSLNPLLTIQQAIENINLCFKELAK